MQEYLKAITHRSQEQKEIPSMVKNEQIGILASKPFFYKRTSDDVEEDDKHLS